MKRLFALAALLVALGSLYFVLRSSDPPKAPSGEASASQPRFVRPPLASRDDPDKETPRFDDDPKGPLQLSGRVLDEEGNPAKGALVSIDSNPPRQMVTGEHGWFVFEGLLGRNY